MLLKWSFGYQGESGLRIAILKTLTINRRMIFNDYLYTCIYHDEFKIQVKAHSHICLVVYNRS